MKTFRPLFAALCLSLCAHGEESLLIPSIDGEWKEAAEAVAPSKDPLVVEPEAGHFYCFVVQGGGEKMSTRVYHSTDAKNFELDSKYLDAMHFVGSLVAVVQAVTKRGDQWFVRAGDKEAKLAWKPIAPAVPNIRHAATDIIRVALYDDSGSAGKGVPSCSAQLGAVPGMEVTKLDANGIRAGLSGYDVVIFSGGSGGKQANTIGLSGREQVNRFVNAGGGYVGICAGSYLACTGFSWGVQVLNAKTPSPLWERGHADLEIEATATGQEVLGLPAKAKVIYHNGPILTPGLKTDLPAYEPLVFFRAETFKTEKQKGLQINTPAMARGTCGKGHVLVSSPHPEQTPGMEHWLEHAVRAVLSPL